MRSRHFAQSRCAVTRDGPIAEALNAADANEWLTRMRYGHFELAWQASDRIRQRSGPSDWTVARHFQRVWDGTPFDGRRVLIRCYHGLGDTIQFIRYAPLVRVAAAEVIVWAQPALVPMLRDAPGIDKALPLHDGSPEVDYDVDIEVMELPYAFRTTVATIPDTVPYLSAFGTALNGKAPRVGIAWRAGDWNDDRSLQFRDLLRLFDGTQVSWHALQLDRGLNEHHPRLRAIDTSTIPLLASAIASLDLIISIDSMPAHLSGALGRPVWTLLPDVADWRWMENRDDSPWYPTMRLFRQGTGGWPALIERVHHALAQRA
jgi:hypothetical protein